MNKILIGLVVLLLLPIGCSVAPTKIVLPNGANGLVIDCSGTGWSSCFVAAGETCPNGYKIYERTKEEFTDSKIPITDLPNKADMPVLPEKQRNILPVDKYMVISCTV